MASLYFEVRSARPKLHVRLRRLQSEVSPLLSLCAIALDEEAMIGDMLESVQGLADEIIVGVDSRTTDATCEIVDQYGGKGFSFDWRDDFSYARNLTIDRAHGRWILTLDADERLTTAGVAAIREIVECASEVPANDAVTGIAFWMEERSMDETLHVIQRTAARLFRRRPEIRYTGTVHEEPFWLGDREQSTVLVIDGEPHMIHYGYDPELWRARGKYERNLRLLEKRVADNPNDKYAADKLAAHKVLAGS